jgi:hypothetical protein
MLVFGWEMNNDYGLLDDVFNRNQDILGDEGTTAIGECVESQLAQSPEASIKFANRRGPEPASSIGKAQRYPLRATGDSPNFGPQAT